MIFSSGRVALYVSKRIDRTTWTIDGGEDWAAVTFGKGDDVLTVISIYSELHNRNWKTPLKELTDKPPLRGRTVIVGDFNAYYPMWDRDRRQLPEVEYVLRLVIGWNLELLILWGEITRRLKRGDRDSTIDLAWTSRNLSATYNGPDDLPGSDYAV